MATKEQTAAILIIGDEILSGKVREENARYLILELRALGVLVRHVAFLPDDIGIIGRETKRHSEEQDLVFTTGGVGPTHDDVTTKGIANGFEVPVVSDPKLEELVRRFYGDRLCPSHLLLAQVPEGTVLETDGKSDAAFVTRFRNVFIFPGVPSLLKAKFPVIREQFRAQPFWNGKIFCTCDEGTIAEALGELAKSLTGISIGSYPKIDNPEYKVMLTVEGKDQETVAHAFEKMTDTFSSHILRSEPPRPIKTEGSQ